MEKIKSVIDKSFSREIINYSMVWEDPNLLIQSLPSLQRTNILTISSAGDNALSLLAKPHSNVTAVDMSEPQNHLLRLKKILIQNVTHAEYLNFFGYQKVSENERIRIYDSIKSKLEPSCKEYWNAQVNLIKSGIIHCGRLESYFNKFQEHGIQKIFSQEDLKLLIENSDLGIQRSIIKEKTSELESFISNFFNQKSFSAEGRSEAQYKYVNKSVSIESHIAQRTFNALQNHLISENSYLHYIFTKEFSYKNLPDHLQLETFKKIQKNINNLTVITADLEAVISRQETKFDFFNLSDVFEYVSEQHFEEMLSLISLNSSPLAKICYWSLFVDRQPSPNSSWEQNKVLSESLHKKDRVWFYKNFNVLEKN